MTCPACSAENEPRAKACFACGAPLDAATPTFTEGLIFAERYSVQAPIGRGGMGMVYRARDLQRDGVVALKIVRPDIARESDRAFRRFQSEITLARRVRHPNVCAIYDDGIDHGLP
jgi:predicted unusual protein kinase regulating ubiquinone biosynthesis (AarF/ABC1/UbiB family)